MEAWSQGEHELLSSMTKGEIVDEIFIDANMVLRLLMIYGSIYDHGGGAHGNF